MVGATVAALAAVIVGRCCASRWLPSLRDDAFTSSIAHIERFHPIYFSFIALTTVGFGDITTSIDLTRALAMSEAIVGQLFLVTVVAYVVSRLGQARRVNAPDPPDELGERPGG